MLSFVQRFQISVRVVGVVIIVEIFQIQMIMNIYLLEIGIA
jgi:hypothetical protein